MPYCPKCGAETTQEMAYCSKCGAPISAATATERGYSEKHEKQEKEEKDEKHEKQEKEEKDEKHEKGETSRFWVLIGGLFLVIIGVVSIVTTLVDIPQPWRGAFWLIIVGIVIIIVAVYMATRASKRNPRP